jgi:hypothetical protein
MEQQIHFLDANPQAIKGTALSPIDNAGTGHLSDEQDDLRGEPHLTGLESNAFAFITGVLMSGALVAAVGTLIEAIARALS